MACHIVHLHILHTFMYSTLFFLGLFYRRGQKNMSKVNLAGKAFEKLIKPQLVRLLASSYAVAKSRGLDLSPSEFASLVYGYMAGDVSMMALDDDYNLAANYLLGKEEKNHG